MKRLLLSVLIITALLGVFIFKFLKTDKVAAGNSYGSPQIYIYGGDSTFSSAGLIPLASTDDPVVTVGGYNISGTADVSIYKADINSLLDYLTHDKDNKQTKAKPDINKLEYLATTSQNLSSGNEGTKISLPLSETGIWYLKMKIGNISVDAYVLKSATGVLAKKGLNDFTLWGQNYKTKRSISSGDVQIYSLQNTPRVIQNTSFDSSGIAHAALSVDADIALIKTANDIAIVPLNLMYLNSGGSYANFGPTKISTKYFTFTDRPIYKPGDTVYFKSILRNDDDARYSIPVGSAEVKIYNSNYYGYIDESAGQSPVYSTNLSISPEGTINGSYKIPENGKTGYYSISVKSGGDYGGSTSFNVEYYQKPEYFINVDAKSLEYTAGDAGSFKISGSYFSGQPLAKQKVKYSVSSSDFYEYDYINDLQYIKGYLENSSRYYFSYGSHKVLEDSIDLDKNGQAVVSLPTKMDFNAGKSQIFTIEATLDDGTQTPAMSRKNIIVYAGEFGIYRSNYKYGGKVNTNVELPITLASLTSDKKFSNIDLTAKVHRESWEEYSDPKYKYPQYKKIDEDLQQITAKTDANGNASFNFVPSKTGYYKLTVSGKDARGNTISKEFYQYIWQEDYPYYSGGSQSNISVSLDKQKYEPGDTVHLSLYSQIADRDVFISIERGRFDRFYEVHLSGKNGTLDIPLLDTDLPNTFIKAQSFSANGFDSVVQKIAISTNSKKVIVGITPDAKKYGPGENVTLTINTKDANGNAVSADTAVWVVDKAIFELSDSNLGNIFDTYWADRWDSAAEAHSLQGITVYASERGGGCFAAGTKVLLASGQTKNIEDIKIGDQVAAFADPNSKLTTKTKVTGIQKARDNGYLIINRTLKVTPDHIMWSNGAWNTAGSIQIGDKLMDANGKDILVESIEWQKGKSDVYNLEVEKYHNFFADGVLVHNQKGDARTQFADAAYWNPSVHTDQNGTAKVSFKLPDNLTTWAIAAVADTSDTKVGQATAEIISSKDIIVRPVLPNILRVGDDLEVSALVQNFTDTDHVFNVALKFDSGSVVSEDFPNVKIAANSSERYYWEIKPEKENKNNKLTFSAIDTGNKKLNDIIAAPIPVKAFEFEEKKGESGLNNKTYNINLASDINKEKSTLILSLSTTMLGTLPSAMSYLVHYPYGCTEQTVTSLSAALIAKFNQNIFADVTSDKNLDDIIQKGITRVSNQQQGDGGWTWWFTGPSDPFVTSYVIENLLSAQKLGFDIDPSVLAGAKKYLESPTYYDNPTTSTREYSKEDWASKDYGLALLGGSNLYRKITDFNGLTPDMLSLLVIANYKSGDTNPATNGLTQLESLAQPKGDGVYWNAGNKLHFGSVDASTGMAMRAISYAKGNSDLAKKGAMELIRSRKFDYWSSTYGTMQVIHGIMDLAKSSGDLTPNLAYKVTANGTPVTSGKVTNVSQTIKDIKIPLTKSVDGKLGLNVIVEGTGDLYSTLVTDEFHTDTNAKASGNIISISKEYVNDKGDNYNLSPGDSVTVKLTINWPQEAENYAVITDELPSGLSPINTNLNNQQYGVKDSYNRYFGSYNVTGMETTQNGAILSLYRLDKGIQTYSYHARVIAAGTFLVPPATVSLMYSPEINARTAATTLNIAKESIVIPRLPKISDVVNSPWYVAGFKYALGGVGVILILAGVLWKSGVVAKLKMFKKNPPVPPAAPPVAPGI